MKTSMSEMGQPKRKPIRLPEYDYSAPGAYFVTICTRDKRRILSDIAVGAVHERPAVVLTEAGECVQRVIAVLPARYDNLVVDHSVIMPNHIHLLLRIEEERAVRERPLRQESDSFVGAIQESPADASGRRRSLLDKAIGYLKMNSSKQIHAFDPGLTVWQRSYHEHVIRNERDYREIWEYIENNPARWAEDRYCAE